LAAARLLNALPAAMLAVFVACAPALAETRAGATYVVNLGGNIIATANFALTDNGGAYDLTLNANVSGLASLVAAGVLKAHSTGTVGADALTADTFDLITHTGGQDFKVQVQYAGSDVTAFVVDPPIVNNIDRVPIERKQLAHVNDMLAAFIRHAPKLDKSICSYDAHIFTGTERFDLDFQYAKDDTATSPRTGYQGPVVLCRVAYKPISGHYTTSELTNSLAQDDRILIWYAPLRDTGYFIPYRVLLTTSMGDLSLVLTSLD
jgi:hypothetical protein